jgi:RNA polymerase sigma factor (TIGR02999 family)
VPGRHAADGLLPLVYDQLRRLARRYMRGERRGHTLEPTALVHEAYLRLQDLEHIDWKGKTHFYAMAARQMRRILVEHARAAGAQKRGAERQRITLSEEVALTPERSLDLIALDQALTALERQSRRQAQVAELRLFAGMSMAEVAESLAVCERTVKQDWRMARAWLSRELRAGREAP